MPASAVPVEKVVTRVADSAMDDTQPSKPELTPSAVAPAVATFNLPTLPPIPDQAKPAVSDFEASEAVKVTVPTAAPMPAQPISRPPQQVTVASTDNAIDKVNESVAAPMSEAVPAPRPVVVANPPAPAVTPAPQARPAISPEPVAPISEPTSAAPAVVVPAPSAPLPKQGDLLAHPTHPAASIAPRDEEHKSDLHD
jgi:ribonuclease E